MKPHISLVPLLRSHAALAASSLSASSPSVSTLFSLPDTSVPSWFENLAVRPGGQSILATRLDVPQLWSIDIDNASSTATGTLVANATGSTALVGITAGSPLAPSCSNQRRQQQEVYYIAGVNYTAQGVQPNSSVLYSLTYHHSSCSSSTTSSPSPYTFTQKPALAIPQMTLINGLASLSPTAILATDSYQGAIYKIDTSTGEASIVLQDSKTMATNSSSAGVNGVKVLWPRSDGETTPSQVYVYYTNTNQALVARVPVNVETGTALGVVEILTQGNELLGQPDDFALLDDGSVIVATGAANTLVHVGLDGAVMTLAGSQGSLELASSTACQLGPDGRVLYVTTAGGAEGAVNGTLYGPGKVVAVGLGQKAVR